MKKFIIKVGAVMVCGAVIFAFGAGAGLYLSHRAADTAAEAENTAQGETAAAAEETTADIGGSITTVAAEAAELTKVQLTLTKGTTWESGGKICAQYDGLIKNEGEIIDDWQAVVRFNTGLKITQIWNGAYTQEGTVLKITPAEYNGEIAQGSEITFGFIGEFDTEPDAEPEIKLYSGDEEIKTTKNPLSEAGTAAQALTGAATQAPKQETAPTGTPVQLNGQLSVKGTQIVNQSGSPFVIKGVSTHGIAWYPQYITLESFRTLRDTMGANTVRLALYSSSGEGYNTSLHQKVDEGVRYASQLGMYAVIDWHILGNGNPNTDKAAAEAFFKEMAGKYKDYNNVLYEICNEPNGDVQWERDIKPYAEGMVNTIRAIDNDAIIIIGTPTWSQDVDIAAKSPVQGTNLVYAFHFYAATHKAQFRDKVSAAVNAGLPVLVSEFGITDASGNGSVDVAEADKWMEFLDERGIGRICWNLSNKNEASALIASSCTKTSDWSDSELSAEGQWLKKTYNK